MLTCGIYQLFDFFPLVIVLFLLINYIIKHSNNLNYLIVILHNFSQEAQQFNKMATKLKIVKDSRLHLEKKKIVNLIGINKNYLYSLFFFKKNYGLDTS